MESWKAEQRSGVSRCKNREEKWSQKKENTEARNVRKIAKCCVSPMIYGSVGSKSRLAKAAGAEIAAQSRQETLHAVIHLLHPLSSLSFIILILIVLIILMILLMLTILLIINIKQDVLDGCAAAPESNPDPFSLEFLPEWGKSHRCISYFALGVAHVYMVLGIQKRFWISSFSFM